MLNILHIDNYSMETNNKSSKKNYSESFVTINIISKNEEMEEGNKTFYEFKTISKKNISYKNLLKKNEDLIKKYG